MDTKTSRTTYLQYNDLSFLEEKVKEKPKGLLTPTRMSDKMTNSNMDQPAYRVAKYLSKIRSMNPKKNKVA